MESKLWESEFWAINFATGKAESVRSEHYFLGVNLEQAQLALLQSGMTWLRLTGTWFNNQQTAQNHNEFYELVKNPKNIVDGMDFDQFLDWLELGNEDDVRAALKEFEDAGLEEHVKVMKVHLKLRYGNKENDNEEEGEETR